MAVERGSARRRVAEALARAPSHRIPDSACEARAAVALVLRPGVEREPPRPTARTEDPTLDRLSLLLVQRAEVEGDPWSGHMALPGGRREPGDEDLAATALRETREETALRLAREDVLGRIDETHPFTRHLPSIAVTPFVIWDGGAARVRGNVEVRDHVWMPLPALRDPRHRSAFTLRRGERVISFPTIEYGGFTVWGLTFEIIARFLDRVRDLP